MGLFDRKKGPVPVTPEQMDAFEHLDQQVALAVRDGQINFQGTLHVCVTQAGLDRAMERLKPAGGQLTACQSVLGQALDAVIQQPDLHDLILYGLAGNETEFLLTEGSLEGMRDVVDSFCILYAAARGALPQEKAQDLMREKTVWFLGELPRTGKKGETFGFATIKREGYEAVRCFLTPESAGKFNREGCPVTPVRAADLEQFVAGTYALIIEPHRNYWLELGAEAAKGAGG